MSIQVRHVVTGRDANGKSVIVSDEKTPAISVGAIPGSEFYIVWGTENGFHSVGITSEEPKRFPFFPGPGGPGFLLRRWPPASSTPAPAGDPEQLGAQIE